MFLLFFPDDGAHVHGTEDEDLYTLAQTAIWAGDFVAADLLLSRYLIHRFGTVNPPSINAYADPIGHSAARLRRQLIGRRGEFFRQRTAAGLTEEALGHLPTILTSIGKSVRGAVWRRDDREIEMLAFLTNLEREGEFYESAILHSSSRLDDSMWPDYKDPSRKPHPDALESESQTTTDFDATWVLPGDLFLRVFVSDFATMEVNGLWTAEELPSGDDVLAPLQCVLDSMDSATP